MLLLYGLRGASASQAVARKPSIRLSQGAIRFQLAGEWDAVSLCAMVALARHQ
jgi:hypothetical protein